MVLRSGLTESILPGLLSVNVLCVLHPVHNDYYVNMNQMVDKFAVGTGGPNDVLGSSCDCNMDGIPKFLMAGGNVVNTLLLHMAFRACRMRLRGSRRCTATHSCCRRCLLGCCTTTTGRR